MRALGVGSVMVASGFLAGCGGMSSDVRLSEPRAEEPKALVNFRVDHAVSPGDHSRDRLSYDGFEIDAGEHALFPQPARLAFATKFWHEESHTERRSVPVTSYEYSSESRYNYCISTDRRGRCESGTTTERVRRAVTTYEMQNVLVTTEVPDGACSASQAYRFSAGRRYQVVFTFRADGQCEVSCNVDDGQQCDPLAASVAVPPPVRDKYSAHPLHGVGIGLTALGVAGLATAAGTGIVALAQKPTIRDHCDANKLCDGEGIRASARGLDYSIATTILGLGGGAALIAGLVLAGKPGTWTRLMIGASPTSVQLSGRFE